MCAQIYVNRTISILNGIQGYSKRELQCLGLASCFAGIYSTQSTVFLSEFELTMQNCIEL